MAYIIAFATLISLPAAEYLIKKKGFSYPKAMSVALLLCWSITALVSLFIKWLISQ
jgi:hypothetical protein